MSPFGFHPVVERWFQARFAAATEPQRLGWPAIAAGRHALIAAPTGSGKTLAAFLAVIDRLLKSAEADVPAEELRVVYVSPLRALSNDMHRNLEVPLREIAAEAEAHGVALPEIRVGLRTGDTPPAQRAALLRRPPQILVTTPESLYLLLTAEKGRERLATVDTVIVDEIHALVRDKRGSHLALTLERLESLNAKSRPDRPLQRIGLSATQKPIELVARFLVGERETAFIRPGEQPPAVSATEGSKPNPDCCIADVGHRRDLDLAVETPETELGAVCTHEQWAEVHARVVELIKQHRSTLIFVNTRRMAERVTHQLTQLLGEDAVGSHHGSLAAGIRLKTEQALKNGEIKAVVATASLELGLDVGYIDLVIQLGSPRSIATFLQRIGRSGHSLGLLPKGRLFALTRDELLESMALIRAVRSGVLDALRMPAAPLDVLAQQIVAEVAGEPWDVDALFQSFKTAFPYRELSRESFERVLEFLSEGIARQAGRSRVYLHYDRVGGRLRARRGARIAATSNGGAIPEMASYRVVNEPDRTVVGTVDEDFAIESLRGDVFLLGNTSWRIQHVRGGEVVVTDAHGAPPTIPFWFGEANGRTRELSEEVSRLREDLESRLDMPRTESIAWLAAETGCTEDDARQAFDYAATQRAAIGLIPSQSRVVFERFFDETGGMQLVIHAPFGGAITRAWGYALRKRFCRSFDFELQATADDDGIILSIGPQHSFPLESMFGMLTAANVKRLLEQAVLVQPPFQVRWRWNVTRALLVLRQKFGKKVPPPLQRFRADDLLTAVFPRLTGCQENAVGDIELPDHPLVRQTMDDCLHEALDLEGLIDVLGRIEHGQIELVPRDTREPSPFCYELLNANPYAFLDGGEIQERRTQALSLRRTLDVESVSDLGRLDPAAIAQVCREAEPLVRGADELHDVLLSRIVCPVEEDWRDFFDELANVRRAARIVLPGGREAWVPAERLPAVQAVFDVTPDPSLEVPAGVRQDWTASEARLAVIRGLLEVCGPIASEEVARRLSLEQSPTEAGLEALEGEGTVLRGRFTEAARADTAPIEWCHRRLLARIHRLTLHGLRRQIEPVGVDVFVRFLIRHQGLHPASRRAGTNGVFEVVSMLQGLDAPALAWERDLLPARLEGYESIWLDELCLTGEIGWGRLFPPRQTGEQRKPSSGLTRVVPVSVFLRGDRDWLAGALDTPLEANGLSGAATEIYERLERDGATFAADLLRETRMLPTHLEAALGELIARGLLTGDSFGGLRSLIAEKTDLLGRQTRRPKPGLARKRAVATPVGRWSLWRRDATVDAGEWIEHWTWQLLRRWGVVFRDLLQREDGAPRWWQLLQVLRRLEARGEIRGGRFISGVGGEQFALPDTVGQLRDLRDAGPQQELIAVSAADPLNLVGIVTNHPRVPSTASNRVAYLDGVPVAALQGGATVWLSDDAKLDRAAVEAALTGRRPAEEQASEKTGRRKAQIPHRIPRPLTS